MDQSAMTVEQARDALRAGRQITMVIGIGLDDPTIVLSLYDGMVMSTSVAGWSAGVVEPVCGIDSDFLRDYLQGRQSVTVS